MKLWASILSCLSNRLFSFLDFYSLQLLSYCTVLSLRSVQSIRSLSLDYFKLLGLYKCSRFDCGGPLSYRTFLDNIAVFIRGASSLKQLTLINFDYFETKRILTGVKGYIRLSEFCFMTEYVYSYNIIEVVIELIEQAQSLDCLKLLDLRNNPCLNNPMTRCHIENKLPNTVKVIF